MDVIRIPKVSLTSFLYSLEVAPAVGGEWSVDRGKEDQADTLSPLHLFLPFFPFSSVAFATLQVDGVVQERNGIKTEGVLHLTLHHMIFAAEGEEEIWVSSREPDKRDRPCLLFQADLFLLLSTSSSILQTAYPLINLVTRLPQTFNGLSPLCIRTRTFETFTLSFFVDQRCGDVFETVKDLTVARE